MNSSEKNYHFKYVTNTAGGRSRFGVGVGVG